MKIPDLIGIKIEKAKKIIEDLSGNYKIFIKETVSPFIKNPYKENECRVVRQQIFDNTIIITVSYF
ncbi:hypothetical protein [Maledivibacter halophilus]|uniref:PASTA domain-containing protein n=1 Tax=Maledivibacter halophilus TaxID=36842 RepID=A0A1T5LFI9_9FIRM|nr:hypothetical protein [Maledivibacter halophilus]SKC74168.1 hypothetical protein SAMN02194393_02824 [Maledivibacter halophilus]